MHNYYDYFCVKLQNTCIKTWYSERYICNRNVISNADNLRDELYPIVLRRIVMYHVKSERLFFCAMYNYSTNKRNVNKFRN